MMHRALLALIFIVSVSSASLLKKSIVRRQSDAQNCQVIQGFDCKCSHYRVTCTTDGDLQSGINVLPNQQEQYASVELVIQGEREYSIYDSTFEPIKQLYKTDVGHLDFRIKFEKFTALHLRSPGIFNRVFPDNLQSKAKTTIVSREFHMFSFKQIIHNDFFTFFFLSLGFGNLQSTCSTT